MIGAGPGQSETLELVSSVSLCVIGPWRGNETELSNSSVRYIPTKTFLQLRRLVAITVQPVFSPDQLSLANQELFEDLCFVCFKIN